MKTRTKQVIGVVIASLLFLSGIAGVFAVEDNSQYDKNEDCLVNMIDVSWQSAFVQEIKASDGTYAAEYDLNGDGEVNLIDMAKAKSIMEEMKANDGKDVVNCSSSFRWVNEIETINLIGVENNSVYDLNGDCVINLIDLAKAKDFMNAIKEHDGSPIEENEEYDINGDGNVNLIDAAKQKYIMGVIKGLDGTVLECAFVEEDFGEILILLGGGDEEAVCQPNGYDLNCDCVVNLIDVAKQWKLVQDIKASDGTYAAEYDLNGDGEVNLIDMAKAKSIMEEIKAHNGDILECANEASWVNEIEAIVLTGEEDISIYDLNEDCNINLIDMAKAKWFMDEIKANMGVEKYDLNGDGEIDNLDVAFLAGLAGGNFYDEKYDFNNDGKITGQDVSLVAQNQGKISIYDINGDGNVDLIDVAKQKDIMGIIKGLDGTVLECGLAPVAAPTVSSSGGSSGGGGGGGSVPKAVSNDSSAPEEVVLNEEVAADESVNESSNVIEEADVLDNGNIIAEILGKIKEFLAGLFD